MRVNFAPVGVGRLGTPFTLRLEGVSFFEQLVHISESAPSSWTSLQSPDWPPERAASPSGAYATVSTVGFFPEPVSYGARGFLAAVFLGGGLSFSHRAFFGATFFVSFAFLPAIFSSLLFGLPFGAIRAVYHRSAIPRRRGYKKRRRETGMRTGDETVASIGNCVGELSVTISRSQENGPV